MKNVHPLLNSVKKFHNNFIQLSDRMKNIYNRWLLKRLDVLWEKQ